MDARKISDALSVAPQLSQADIAAAVQAGFRSILCNRPDGESYDQPDFSLIAAAAKQAGLAVMYQPFVSSAIGGAEAAAFAQAVTELPQPVLAYCRSGTRCTVLWSLSQAGKRPAAEILAVAANAGYDMRALGPKLEAKA